MRLLFCYLLGGHFWRYTRWHMSDYGWRRCKSCILCHARAREGTNMKRRPLDVH